MSKTHKKVNPLKKVLKNLGCIDECKIPTFSFHTSIIVCHQSQGHKVYFGDY